MRVAVVGGTGTIGRPLVAELVERGNDVLVLSRGISPVPPDTPATERSGGSARHRRADVVSGEGLADALAGVEAVVDAANGQRRARAVLVDGTKRLVEAGARAGVGHHLLISIVGIDRVPMPYYRWKLAQEEAVVGGAVPWTILRATQFHPLLGWAFAGAARLRLRPTGEARLQPIDTSVVARRMADAVEAGPAGRAPDLAGPEVRTLDELSAAWREAHGRRLLPVRFPSIGRLGRALRAGGLCEEAGTTPGPTFEEWLRDG
jgi:uncharacterized protein YbjT (DUF2867 family)